MSRCRVCGNYCDIFEYPPEERENYHPNLCFTCYQESLQNNDDEEADDPNTEFGMTEVKPDPEDDDTPDLQASNDDDTNETEDDANATESEPLPDDTDSIANIKRMLFG